MKRCCFCGAELANEAHFCLQCMTAAEEKTVIPPYKAVIRRWKIFAIALFGCILLAVTIWALPYGASPEAREKPAWNTDINDPSAINTDSGIFDSDPEVDG